MWHTKHHDFANRIIKPILRLYSFKKNHFKSKVYKLDKNKSYIILANHQTTWDPILLYCSFKNIIYPVMAKDFIPVKYRKLIYKYLGPVLKAKTLKDLQAVKNMLQVVKEGNNLYLYPEGNRTYSGELCYFSDATIKFIKKAKCDVVYYNFKGGYGVDPRWGTSIRKGKFEGEIRSILPFEEIEKMSIEELLAHTKKELSVVEAPSENEYKSSKRAEALERTLYRCPICKNISKLHSQGNYLSCECGLKVEYTSKLTFNCSDLRFKYKTVNDWFVDQEKWIRSYEYQGSDPIFEDENIILHKIFIDHNEEVTRGKLSLYEDYLLIGEKRFDFSSIIEMTVSSKQTLIFYVDDISYRLSSDIVGVNFIKYMQMYYHLNNKKLGFADDFLGI